MKALPIFSLSLIASILFLAGCGKESSGSAQATNEVSGGNLATAPVEYLGAAAKAKQTMEKTIDTVSLNQAIQQFYAGEGRFPKDLDELKTKGYVREVPKPPYGYEIKYDAAAGTVKVVKK